VYFSFLRDPRHRITAVPYLIAIQGVARLRQRGGVSPPPLVSCTRGPLLRWFNLSCGGKEPGVGQCYHLLSVVLLAWLVVFERPLVPEISTNIGTNEEDSFQYGKLESGPVCSPLSDEERAE